MWWCFLQGDLSASGADPQATGGPSVQGGGGFAQQELMTYEEPAAEEDNSLLTFEEDDVEFDPLKRSDSLAGRSDSLSKSGKSPSSTTTNCATLEQPSLELPGASLNQVGITPAPLTSKESLSLIQDLTGIDLTSSSAPQMRQDGLSSEKMMYPFQMSSAEPPVNLVVASSAGMVPYPQGGVQIMTAPMGGQGHALQGGMAYGGGAPAMQVYGGGAPAVVPMVYAPQGNAALMYQVSNFGSKYVLTMSSRRRLEREVNVLP